MSASSDFEDTVNICKFYSEFSYGIEVDYENHRIIVDGYTVEPVMEGGHLINYIVKDPEGKSHFVGDLDSFFQRAFGWTWV